MTITELDCCPLTGDAAGVPGTGHVVALSARVVVRNGTSAGLPAFVAVEEPRPGAGVGEAELADALAGLIGQAAPASRLAAELQALAGRLRAG